MHSLIKKIEIISTIPKNSLSNYKIMTMIFKSVIISKSLKNILIYLKKLLNHILDLPFYILITF